ncbi:MAG: OmpA family protein [Actinomycetota bacterium]
MLSPAGDASDDGDPFLGLAITLAVTIALVVSAVVVATAGGHGGQTATSSTMATSTTGAPAPPTTSLRPPAPIGVSVVWADDGSAEIRGTVQSEDQFEAIVAASGAAFGEDNVEADRLLVDDSGGVNADERIGVFVSIIDRMPSRLTEGVALLQDRRLTLTGTLAPGFGDDVFDDLLETATDAGLATGTDLAAPVELAAYERTIEVGDAEIVVGGTVSSSDDAAALIAALEQLGLGGVVNELEITTVSPTDGSVTLIGELGDAEAEALRALVADAMVRDQLVVVSAEEEAIDQLNELFSLEPILFDTGQATIRDESASTLDRAAEILVEVEGAAVSIAGHTDSQGDAEANLVLSEDRAEAVLQALVERGVDPGSVIAEGFGESRPIDDNTTDEGRQANRRIEFRLLGA